MTREFGMDYNTRPSLRSYTVVAIAGLFLLYEFILQVSPSVITSTLMQRFQVNALGLGTAMSMYYFSYAPMQLMAGISYDRFGARRTICVAILFCALGTLLLASAHTIFYAGLGRLLTGFGSAFAFVGMLFLGRVWFNVRHFYIIVGLTEFMGAMGAFTGQAPISATVHHFGWQTTFMGLAIGGVLLAVLALFIIRDNERQVEAASHSSWNVKQRIGFVLKNRQLWFIGLFAFFIFAPVSGFAALWGVPFLQTKFHISTTQAAAVCSMIWLGMALGTPFASYISEIIGRRVLPLIITGAMGIAITLFVLFGPHIPTVWLFILLFFYGVATVGQAMSFLLVTENVPHCVVGTAMGFNNFMIVISGAIVQPLIGGLLDLHWVGKVANHVPVYSVHNYQTALIVLPISFAIATILALFFIKETGCHSHMPMSEEKA